MARAELRPTPVQYPESDGKPMAETDIHRDLMLDLIASAAYYFRDAREVYVSGNLLLYYEEGNPGASVAPDVFVVRGVKKGRRRIYKLWEEKKPPLLAIELTSRSTRIEDFGTKKAVYEQIGVEEYFIFDPEAPWSPSLLRAYRRQDGELLPAKDVREADGKLIARSETLGLELWAEAGSLRWADPASGKPLPVPTDFYAAAEQEMNRAEAEKARAEAAEARAEKERKRAEAAEAEVRRLREQLERGPGRK